MSSCYSGNPSALISETLRPGGLPSRFGHSRRGVKLAPRTRTRHGDQLESVASPHLAGCQEQSVVGKSNYELFQVDAGELFVGAQADAESATVTPRGTPAIDVGDHAAEGVSGVKLDGDCLDLVTTGNPA
jgi:hypothetical protein